MASAIGGGMLQYEAGLSALSAATKLTTATQVASLIDASAVSSDVAGALVNEAGANVASLQNAVSMSLNAWG